MYCKTIFEKKKKKPEKILNFEVHFRSRPKNVLETTKNLKNALKKFFSAFYHQNGSNEGVTK